MAATPPKNHTFPSDQLAADLDCERCGTMTVHIENDDGTYWCGCCFEGLIRCEHSATVTARRIRH